jgi:TonB family protein
MSDESQLNLLLEWEDDAARWRRRTMALVSVFLHILLILLLAATPDLLQRGAELVGANVEPKPKRETTTLFLPPDLLKRLREPPPDASVLSDKNRRAQGRSPVINPKGLRMPYSRGNTPLPELKGGGERPEPAPRPAPPPSPPAAQTPPAGAGSKSAASPAPPKKEDRPQLLDVPAPPAGGELSQLRLPFSTPGEAIRQSTAEAARGRASGAGAGAGDSTGQFQNLNPNFSTEGPIILSDTKGVDFGPYLARIVWTVRRNWYAVIPESARLGQTGRVAVVFEILKDGSVPQLRLVGSSGFDPLDRAALSGIHASVPFPPLPEEFTGNHLVLQFIFLYNMRYTP